MILVVISLVAISIVLNTIFFIVIYKNIKQIHSANSIMLKDLLITTKKLEVISGAKNKNDESCEPIYSLTEMYYKIKGLIYKNGTFLSEIIRNEGKYKPIKATKNEKSMSNTERGKKASNSRNV